MPKSKIFNCPLCGDPETKGYCERCAARFAKLKNFNPTCSCIRRGDFEDVRFCGVHGPGQMEAYGE